MLDTFTLTVIKTEGLGNISNSTCTILLDSSQLSQFPLSDLPFSVTVPTSGIIQLYINDISTSITIVSLSFHTKLITTEWFYWFPLFLSPKNLLNELPVSIPCPKILIGINKDCFDDNPKNLESDETAFEIPKISSPSEEVMKNYNKTIKSLQLELNQLKKTFKQKSRSYITQINQFKSEIDSLKTQNLLLKDQLDRCYKLLSDIYPSHPVDHTENIFKTQDESPDFYPKLDFYSYLDSRVKETLKRIKFENLFKRCKDLNYKVGNKIVTLYWKEGRIYTREGLTFEKYIFNNCRSEIEDLIRQRTILGVSPRKSPSRLCRTPGTSSQKMLRLNN